MKFYNVEGKELTKEGFIKQRDWYIDIYGNAYIERNGDRLRLLDPSKIMTVWKK